ncbi:MULTISPECIES: HamA C-terminal domain-containing protein [Bacteroidales]|uniref:HamA C-terminal domain-containing protein n=1 Tax=Bacteroidales TaxID=171549 RepID=UPI001C3C581B|nr:MULTISPECIES: DUF1837 domain-containing protein [Bacteroidales]
MPLPLLEFDVIIDSSLQEIDETLSPRQHFISMSNTFESGKWRESSFIDFLMNNLMLTALSAEERNKMVADNPFSAVKEAAKNLRFSSEKDNGKGGEIAEILLYGIMKRYFNALPVVPKIFYKQNPKDNAKGADSVHIVINDDNEFSLWLGEAKFYDSIDNGRLNKPVKSVLTALTSKAIRKESCLILGYKDLDICVNNTNLSDRIKACLSLNTSLDEIKKVLHIPIMFLHECDLTNSANALSEAFKTSLISKHKSCALSFFKKLNEQQRTFKDEDGDTGIYLFDAISFHLILFPVPNKESIITKFYEKANSIKQ